MICDPDSLLRAAKELPVSDRVRLVRELTDTLSDEELLRLDADFEAELERRWQAFEANPGSAIPADEFIRSLRERARGGRES